LVVSENPSPLGWGKVEHNHFTALALTFYIKIR